MQKGGNTYGADRLFNSRFEDRMCIGSHAFDEVVKELGLVEMPDERAWIQNIYFDTVEFAMPLGHVVRARRYYAGRPEMRLDGGDYYIDEGDVFFSRKTKARARSTLKETGKMLDAKFRLRLGSFRPQMGIQYARRVYKLGMARLTLDYDIEFYNIDENLVCNRAGIESLPNVELKYEGDSPASAINALIRHGAVPNASKQSLLYFDGVNRTVAYEKGLVDKFPGKECELKFDVTTEEPFMKALISAAEGRMKGYRIWGASPQFMKISVVTEYRRMHGTGRDIKFVYHGGTEPVVTVKNKGEFTEQGILIRTKDRKTEIPKSLNGSKVYAVAKGFKKYFTIESEATMNIYHISQDMYYTSENKRLCQLEVESCKSFDTGGRHSAKEILEELDRLGRYLERRYGIRRSTLTKSKWVG